MQPVVVSQLQPASAASEEGLLRAAQDCRRLLSAMHSNALLGDHVRAHSTREPRDPEPARTCAARGNGTAEKSTSWAMHAILAVTTVLIINVNVTYNIIYTVLIITHRRRTRSRPRGPKQRAITAKRIEISPSEEQSTRRGSAVGYLFSFFAYAEKENRTSWRGTDCMLTERGNEPRAVDGP